MNLFKLKLLFGTVALTVSAPGFAEEGELIRDVVVFTGNSVDAPGTIRGAKAVGADEWATPADFPADIPDEELRVSAGVNLSLDPEGKVLSCDSAYVVASKPDHRTLTDWTAAACGIIQRKGRFAYAIDQDGRPVPSMYRMTAMFEIKKPGQKPYMAPPAPAPPSAFYQQRARPKKALALKLRDPAITMRPRAPCLISTQKDALFAAASGSAPDRTRPMRRCAAISPSRNSPLPSAATAW
jgi:hypothetical protein